MLKDTQGKGFQLTFSNGLTISVQFGYGNYCENHVKKTEDKPNLYSYELSSKDAEVAIWNENNDWITNDFIYCKNDDVIGYLSSDSVADLIYKVKNSSCN